MSARITSKYTRLTLPSILLLQVTLGGDAFLHAEWASGAEMMENKKDSRMSCSEHKVVGAWIGSSRRIVRIEADVRGSARRRPQHFESNALQNVTLCSNLEASGVRFSADAASLNCAIRLLCRAAPSRPLAHRSALDDAIN
jgi:hypothetical protein